MSNYDAVKRYRAKHPERYKAQVKKQNDRARILAGAGWAAKTRASRKADPDRFRAYDKKRNTTTTMTNARRAQRRAAKARRRSAERAACNCCTAKKFAEFYAVAALVGYQVDHIVPLIDGGAHCIQNLQMLPVDIHALKTAAENSRRSRRL
jgi:5-methylcytosine-specific restriction endonuclease McrA